MGGGESRNIPPASQKGKYQVQLAASVLGGVPGASAYHTSVLVDGEEFFFDGQGIETSRGPQSHHQIAAQGGNQSNTAMSQNAQVELKELGRTNVSPSSIRARLGQHFAAGSYDLLRKNCNSFTDAAVCMLLGSRLEGKYTRMESMARGSQLVQSQVPDYQPNSAAEGFDIDEVCKKVAPMPLEGGQKLGGGGAPAAGVAEKAMTAEDQRRFVREQRAQRFANMTQQQQPAPPAEPAPETEQRQLLGAE